MALNYVEITREGHYMYWTVGYMCLTFYNNVTSTPHEFVAVTVSIVIVVDMWNYINIQT